VGGTIHSLTHTHTQHKVQLVRQNGDTHIVYMHVACWSSTPRALQNRWLYMNMSTLMTVDNKWWHSSTCCCCQCSLVSAGHFQCYLLPPSEVSGLSPSTLPCSSYRRGRSMNIMIHDARNRTHDIMYISTSCISHIMYILQIHSSANNRNFLVSYRHSSYVSCLPGIWGSPQLYWYTGVVEVNPWIWSHN